MLKQKTKIGIAFAAIFASAFMGSALALATPIYGEDCRLGVFPYNPGASSNTTGSALNPYINFLSAAQCTAHLTYPNAYSPQPPLDADNALKAGSETIRGPIALHEHGYFNNKNHTDSPGSYYYKSFVDKFEITIENDGYTNLNTANISCDTAVPSNYSGDASALYDCQGSVTDTKLWGGTTVSKTTTTENGKSVIKITWDFATQSPNTGRPQIYGNNGSAWKTYNQDGTVKATLNLTDPYNRLLDFGVNLPTKDMGTIWSTTTTSRVLIGDLALNKNNYPANFNTGCPNNNVNDAASGWCYLTPSGYPTETVVSSGTNRTYYWYPVGSVGNVWKKPPVEPTTCADLSLLIKQNGQVVQMADVIADTPMTLTVTPTYNPSNKTVPLKYKWSAGTWIFNPVGMFKNNIASDPDAGNPYAYDTDTGVYYSGGAKDTIVSVDAYYVADGKQATPCHREFPITKLPPPGATCTGITLTPNFVTAPGSTPYTATVTFSDGKSYNTTVNWSGTNGTFTKNANEQHMSGASPNLYQYLNTFNATGATATVTAKVTAVQGATNSGICQTGVTWNEKPQKTACYSVALSPNALKAPGSTDLTAVVTYTDGQSHNTELTWSKDANGSLSQAAVQQGQSSQSFTNTYSTGNNSGSATARVTNILDPNVENSTACQKGMTIYQEGGKPYCTDLVIISPNELNSSGSTNLSAKATFSDGNTYDTTVQWTGSNGTYPPGTQTKTQDSGTNFTNTFTITDDNDPASASVSVIDVPDPDAENGPNCSAGKSVSTPPEEDDKCIDIDVYPYGDCYYIDTNPSDYSGLFTWFFDGVEQFTKSKNACVTIPPGTDWKVYASKVSDRANCNDADKTEKRPPEVSKGVRSTYRGGNYVPVISIPSNQKQVDYRITFNADSNSKTTATIIDDISDGSIGGKTMPGNNGSTGHIDYVYGSQNVKRANGTDVPACSIFITENCWTGDIGNGGVTLVKVTGTIHITYKGEVKDSAITPTVCVEGKICQEKYINSARIDYEIFDDEDNVIETGRLTSNEALVQIFCQYILTRAAGDIYLETDLDAGVDIRMCSKYTSGTGVIIKPGEPTPPEIEGETGMGLPSEILSLNHEICTSGQSGSIPDALKPFYGQTVSQLSSQICEVKLQTGTAWQQKTITNDIEENKTRISRWEADYSGMSVSMSSVKLDSQYGDRKVYHIKDGDLTIDQLYTLSDGEGAKTFIVENGDLRIKNNITYGTCLAEKQPCTVNDIASLAFIVLNGSVYVDPSVTEMSGVYFVQEGNRANSGLVSDSGIESYNQLVIYGSVYGDIKPLFLSRLFAGDPALEEAGIVVRFDERIILNTPVGLRDVMSYSSGEVAR